MRDFHGVEDSRSHRKTYIEYTYKGIIVFLWFSHLHRALHDSNSHHSILYGNKFSEHESCMCCKNSFCMRGTDVFILSFIQTYIYQAVSGLAVVFVMPDRLSRERQNLGNTKYDQKMTINKMGAKTSKQNHASKPSASRLRLSNMRTVVLAVLRSASCRWSRK